MSTIWVNKFYLSGVWSSGLCRAPIGGIIRRRIDIRNGYGIDMPFAIYHGRELAPFATELLLVTQADRDEYASVFQPLIHTVPRRGPVSQSKGDRNSPRGGFETGKSHTIWHPRLEPLGITQCIVVSESPVVDDEYGTGHVMIEFLQIRQTPAQAYVKPMAPEKPAALSPLKARIKENDEAIASEEQAQQAAGRPQ